jgi:hypothetical protein
MKTAVYLPLAFLVGPMTGALLRGWQPCCLHFSLWVALVLSPFLFSAFAVRFMRRFRTHHKTRAVVWWFGLGMWSLGAPISCLHALS